MLDERSGLASLLSLRTRVRSVDVVKYLPRKRVSLNPLHLGRFVDLE